MVRMIHSFELFSRVVINTEGRHGQRAADAMVRTIKRKQ